MTREARRRGPATGQSRLYGDPIYVAVQLLVLFKVAVVLFAFYPPALDAFNLTKSVVSHVTALVLAALLVWLFARYGKSVFSVSPIHVAVLGIVVAFAVATLFAVDQTLALFGASRRYVGLAQVLDNAVLFLAVATVFRTERDRARLAIGLLIAAVPITVYGLVQSSGRDLVTYVEGPLTRPIAAFGQPDTAGAYFGIAAACALACAVWPWSPAARRTRIACGALGIAATACGVLTGSRGSLLAMGAGLAGLFLVVLLGRYRPALTLRTAALAVVGSGSLLALIGGAMLVRLAPALGVSVESRIEIWQTSLRAIAMSPLVGVGPDNFVAVYPVLHDIRSVALTGGEMQNSTHDFLLYAATSAGVLGLVAVLSVIVLTAAFALRAATRRDPSALVFVVIASYVAQGAITITDVSIEWVPFVAAGLVAATWVVEPKRRVLIPTSGPTSAAIVGVAALAVAVFLGQAQFSRIAASEAQRAAQGPTGASQPLVALNQARAAIQLDGTRAEYWATFGGVLSQAGNPSAAGNAYEEATHRQPWNPLFWRNLALTYVARRDEPHSVQFLQRAVAADPFDVSAHDLLARLAYNQGDWQTAFDEGALAVRILPSNPDLFDAPVRAAVQLGRLTEAEDMLKTGLAKHETAHLRVLLASVYSAVGRRADAIAELDRALALAPGDAEATQLRQQLVTQ